MCVASFRFYMAEKRNIIIIQYIRYIPKQFMKNLLYILFILITISCTKINKQVIVVRDCTGAYLRLDGKDYHVCNLEKIETFTDGSIITASFKKISVCNGSAVNSAVCGMLHENEGWIEVTKAN